MYDLYKSNDSSNLFRGDLGFVEASTFDKAFVVDKVAPKGFGLGLLLDRVVTEDVGLGLEEVGRDGAPVNLNDDDVEFFC